jgi:hypothetical protein
MKKTLIDSNSTSNETQPLCPKVRAIRRRVIHKKPESEIKDIFDAVMYVEGQTHDEFSSFRYRLTIENEMLALEPQSMAFLPKTESCSAAHALAFVHAVNDLERRAQMIGHDLSECNLWIVATDDKFLKNVTQEIRRPDSLSQTEFPAINVGHVLRGMNWIRVLLVRPEDGRTLSSCEDFLIS